MNLRKHRLRNSRRKKGKITWKEYLESTNKKEVGIIEVDGGFISYVVDPDTNKKKRIGFSKTKDGALALSDSCSRK